MIKKQIDYEDITYQVGTCEGLPIRDTVTSQEQREFVESGYGTVRDLIDMYISSYRDWQCDC